MDGVTVAREVRDEAIGEAYRSGATCQEIGDVFSVTEGAVRRVLRKLGVPRRRQSPRTGEFARLSG